MENESLSVLELSKDPRQGALVMLTIKSPTGKSFLVTV